jgi:hypothetical protein
MVQRYQDAMAIVCVYGRPDLFITVTCNPYWPEITRELLFGQQAFDRPDICARVFRLKFKAIMYDINKGKIFGTVVADIHLKNKRCHTIK